MGKENHEGSAKWDDVKTVLSEDNSYLKGLYVLNDEAYSYISYEFCEEETEDVREAFICIKDRESQGDKYFDILEVTIERTHMTWLDVVGRVRFRDINIAGYRDLIFCGI